MRRGEEPAGQIRGMERKPPRMKSLLGVRTVKIALMSGAYKNFGDFLIVQRCRELLSAALPGCEITEYKRNVPVDSCLDEINAADAIVLAGGPAHTEATCTRGSSHSARI